MRALTNYGALRRSDVRFEYYILREMVARCHNNKHKDFKYYGALGVVVFHEWRARGGIVSFLSHVGRRPTKNHSIDRIDPDGSYVPGNVRWVTKKTQMNNRRNTIYDGGIPLSALAEQNRIPYKTIAARWRSGDRGARLTRPVRDWGR